MFKQVFTAALLASTLFSTPRTDASRPREDSYDRVNQETTRDIERARERKERRIEREEDRRQYEQDHKPHSHYSSDIEDDD